VENIAYAGISAGIGPLFIKEIDMRIGTQILGIVAVLLTTPALADEVTVQVGNIKSTQGDLLVAVYDKEESYNANNNWVASRKVMMTGPTMALNFADLPSGNYAIKMFQDENQNGQIDIGPSGIPTEPYGFSNNGGDAGQPSFNEAKVRVDKVTKIEIRLR
jgi:uncharacterized protein (DUF2141 family)